MSDLKPCPFCRGEAEATRWEVGNFGDEEAGVLCLSCGATHAESVGYNPEPGEVNAATVRCVAAWNRRAQEGEK